jgi:hypothetical protein
MHCQRCHDEIDPGEEREYAGRVLCEDCYMDALSPARTCDPWAVHSAKNLAQAGGEAQELNALQKNILEYLQETGGVEPREIAERLQIKPSKLEREIAALRHMEKIRGELREGRKVIRLW